MRFRIAILLLLVAASASPAGGDLLQEGRVRWLHGNYEEARARLEEARKEPKERAAAFVGIARAWQSQGEYDKALGALENALRENPKNAEALARRAELLYLRGSWEEAEKTVERVLESGPEQFLARWVRARIYRDRGELEKADNEFRWFVRTYSARSQADKDIKAPEDLLLVGLAGSENARWNHLSDQFQFILTEVYGDALKAEPDFWPAEYEAGMLLLEKGNRGEALAAFDKALAINPNAAEVLAGKAALAFEKLELAEAERLLERSLHLNARLVPALHLKADVQLALGDPVRARETLDAARAVNPRDEGTLGRIAASLFFRKKTDEFRRIIDQVEARDRKPGRFYSVLAEQLEARRRYPEAEKYYLKSAERWPALAGAPTALGLLYMRMGREAEARTLLEKAFAADGFNVRVSNTLKVLRRLDKYETLKTPHFVIRFDPGHDRLLARYLREYVETTYAALSEKLHYRPDKPILVEVFDSHEMFSGRVVALPDLHTVGASTGLVVALASPHAADLGRRFNWARVIRHELVHVFNLEQTAYQVPHWLTEGLAVENEGYPRPQSWYELLRDHQASGTLFDLDKIDFGFIRPRSADEWTLAYCQSQLYVEYLNERYGAGAIAELLSAYRDGLPTSAALARACGVAQGVFEKGYREYLGQVVGSVGGKRTRWRTFSELQEANEKDPENADCAALLAEQYLLRERSVEARRLADGVLAREKGHAVASSVKARLLLAAGEEEEARSLLEAALGRGGRSEPRILRNLGNMYVRARNFARAAELFEQGHREQPYDNEWLALLAKTYSQAGELDKQMRVLAELVTRDGEDLDSCKELATLWLARGKAGEAERFARQALEIDVLDASAQRCLGDALLTQKKLPQAIEAFEAVLSIDEKSTEARLRLAQAHLESGHRAEAEKYIARVLAGDPTNAEAKRLKKVLGESR